jgi:hypothetical protein
MQNDDDRWMPQQQQQQAIPGANRKVGRGNR